MWWQSGRRTTSGGPTAPAPRAPPRRLLRLSRASSAVLAATIEWRRGKKVLSRLSREQRGVRREAGLRDPVAAHRVSGEPVARRGLEHRPGHVWRAAVAEQCLQPHARAVTFRCAKGRESLRPATTRADKPVTFRCANGRESLRPATTRADKPVTSRCSSPSWPAARRRPARRRRPPCAWPPTNPSCCPPR